MQDYRPTSRVTAVLKELDWPLLQPRSKKGRLSMMHKFRLGLLKISSKYSSNNREPEELPPDQLMHL